VLSVPDSTTPGAPRLQERGSDFRQLVRSWLSRTMQELAGADLDSVEVRSDWDRRLYAAGLAGLTWPVEHGGQGMTPLEEYVFHEEAARAGAPEGNGRIGRILTGPLLIKHGTHEQQERFLEPILRGDEIWCQGFSEPGAGSDLAGVSTRALPDGDDYRIHGQKIWISFADQADRCLLLARTDESAGRHRGLAMFLLDMHQPGVEVRPIRRTTGDSTFSEVYFDGAFARRVQLVGGPTDGWAMAMAVLTDERGPVESITRYMNMSRVVTLLRECCAPEGTPGLEEVVARVELVRWHALRTLENLLAGTPDPAVDGTAKLLWSHTWQDLAAFGIRLGCPDHAGTWEHQYLESRAASIFSGSSQIQRTIVGERVLGLPR
jgi:alkylation response protein AidB-like acyl-CoA dehydrogenase